MNKIVSIIPAAGRPNNSILEHSSLPDTMIPINGKPVLGYILEDIIERGIKKTIIIIHSDDVHTEKYIKLNYSEKIKITILKSKKNRGVGYSVYLAKNFIKKTDGILIYLGDTIYKGKLNFTNNFLVTSNTFEDSKKWCFVEKNKTKFKFINKPQYYKGKGKILCGIYFFKSGIKFKKTLSEVKNKQKIIEMSDLIKNYQEKSENFVLKKANKWYDCGNIENYYLAKTDFLRIRSFNKIKYNQKYGIITKSSTNNKKIIDEINWYLKIPNELKIFTPRLFNFNKNIPNYSIEYYGYPSLADLYIFSYINLKIWNSILNRLFEVIKLFKKYKKNISYKTFTYIYTNKTFDRIKKLKKDNNWNKLLNKKYIY